MTWIYIILVILYDQKYVSADDLLVIGMLLALVKLDEIRDAGKPKWTLVGRWGDGWQWIKK